MAKIALIRVLTCEDDERLNLHGRIIESNFSSLKVDSYCIGGQPKGIYNKGSMEEALPKIIQLGIRLSEGYEGIIVSCAGDPGVKYLNEEVDIPVVGAGGALKSVVGYYGGKAGVIGINEELPDNFKEILSGKEVCYLRPKGIFTTNNIEENKENIVEAARELEGQGCTFITFACTGYSAAGAAELLKGDIGIPVLDIIVTEGMVMNSLITTKSMGEV